MKGVKSTHLHAHPVWPWAGLLMQQKWIFFHFGKMEERKQHPNHGSAMLEVWNTAMVEWVEEADTQHWQGMHAAPALAKQERSKAHWVYLR